MLAVLLTYLLDLGAPAMAWDCARLPPTDFSKLARVYCTDVNGALVTLRVERVEAKK